MNDFNWFQQLDNYCERTDPSFWAEPLNALSNAAFLIAAFCLWRRYRRAFPGPGTRQWELEVLIGLIACVGVGSFLFHTVATLWAQTADVVPIMLALLWALGVFLRREMRYRWGKVAVGFGLFFGATAAFSLVPSEWVNNSQLYFSTALGLFGMAALVRVREQSLRDCWLYTASGCVFLLSLTCRAVDLTVCDGLPIGTHFLWHSLNGLTFYLAVSTLVD